MLNTINVKRTHQILDITPTNTPICLTGAPGVGKTSVVKAYYEAKGYKVVVLCLGQMADAGDITGLPTPDLEKHIMEFLPPHWWTQDQPMCIFLDELNRGRPEIQNVILDGITSGAIMGRKLPEGSLWVGAMNYGDQYQTHELDPAMVSRFSFFEFRPEPEEWLEHAAKSGYDKRVTGFIAQNKGYLYGVSAADTGKGGQGQDENDSGLDKKPEPRAWEKISEICKKIGPGRIEDFAAVLIGGTIGGDAGGKFVKYTRNMTTMGIEDLLFARHDKVNKGEPHKVGKKLYEKSFEDLEMDLMMLPLDEINDLVDNIKVAFSMNKKITVVQQLAWAKNINKFIKWNMPNKETNQSGNEEVLGNLFTVLRDNAELGFIGNLDDDNIMMLAEFAQNFQ